MFLVLAFAAVPFAYTGSLGPGGHLTIDDVNGNVRVRPGAAFTVHAVKRGRRDDPKDVAIRVETAGNRTVICVRYPPNQKASCSEPDESHDNDVTVDFDVTVPRGVALDASSVNGWVDATNDGPIGRAASVNGYVRAAAPSIAEATSVNGRIDLRLTARERDELSVKTVNGDVTVALPASTGARISASTLNGDIRVGLPVVRPQYGPGAHADGTVGDGAMKLRLQSLNGSIIVTR